MDFSFLSSGKNPLGTVSQTNGDNNQQLAVAYVNYQRWEQPYDTEEAFSKGTLFPSLWLPFERGQG